MYTIVLMLKQFNKSNYEYAFPAMDIEHFIKLK